MIFLLSLFCLFQSYLAGEIKVVYTAALLDSFYEERKIEYLRSLQALRKLHITPYIVESCRTSSFFDKERAFVFYSQTNDTSLKNKGINEAISLQKAMDYYRFHDEDILIKLTGRYCFLNGHFFSEI